MPGRLSFAWSRDTHVMVRPGATFSALVSAAEPPRAWTLWRRPLAIAGLLGCVVSLVASGVLTVRPIAPAALVWSYVPLAQMFALAVVTWPRRRVVPFGRAVDLFFTGYAPWALFLISLAAQFAFLPPLFGWGRIRVWVGVMAIVLVWSACLDFWFFRTVYRSSRAAAIRDVLLVRMISWTLVFWIFAVPAWTPFGVVPELIEAVRELAR